MQRQSWDWMTPAYDILPGVNAGGSSRWGYRLPTHGGELPTLLSRWGGFLEGGVVHSRW